MLIRDGVRFGILSADIFDQIDRSIVRGGIDAETLGWLNYPGVAKNVAKQRVKVLICKMNDALEETTTRIVNRDGLYNVVRHGNRPTGSSRSTGNRRARTR